MHNLGDGQATPIGTEPFAEEPAQGVLQMVEALARALSGRVGQDPPVARSRSPPRCGNWRNITIEPWNRAGSRPLHERLQARDWHPKHGPPAHSRTLMDEVSNVLRFTYDGLPLHTVTVHTKTVGRDGAREAFVRRYAPGLCKRAKERGAVTADQRLDPSPAEEVLGDWLVQMSKPKGRGLNGFEWAGFKASSTELKAVAQIAIAEHASKR